MVKKGIIVFSCAVFLCLSSFAINTKAEADETVKAFLNTLEEAISKMDTYKFVSISENWKGKECEKKVTMFRFKKPNLMRTDVLAGPKKGNAVVLNKEGKIVGRNAMGFKKTLKSTDKRLQNIRGLTFMNASLLDKLSRIKEHILKRGCKASLTDEEWAGVPTFHLSIDHKDPDDAVTREDLWFDKESYAVLKNLKHEDGNIVTDVTWQDVEINIPLDDKLFEL